MSDLNKKTICAEDSGNIAQIRKITWIGLIVNILLAAIKFTLGIVGRSHAVVADAVHSLSDLGTDFAILFGVKYWSKPADEDHPYGHRRIETFVTLLISCALLGVAVAIGYNALISLRDAHVRQPGWIAFYGALLSIVFKEVLYRWTFKVGKRAKSSAVLANAWHHRTDAFSSIPVAIAVAAAIFSKKWYFLDNVGAFVVSLFILHAGWKILKDAFLEMLDTGASEEYREKILKIVLETEGVKSAHGLRTRKVGSGLYVDLHIQVDPEISVQKGHEISGLVKNNLLTKGPDILDVMIHLEPFE